MTPWERRLADLAHILGTCHAKYMEPSLFRMNTNQFLQTSRTITFIIQKNKASIPNFDEWYRAAVIEPWSGDQVMTWAKESRNAIEKEGDLDLHSTLRCTLIASYLVEQDIEVKVERADLLEAGIKKLVRIARRHLPTGLEDAAVIKVERRWVTNSLDTWELLHALTYIYTRTYEACRSLSRHLKSVVDPHIPKPEEFERFRDGAQRIEYFKAAALQPHSFTIGTRTIRREDKSKLPVEMQNALAHIDAAAIGKETMASTSEKLAYMAEKTFSHFGNHVPMLFLYDENWTTIDMISTEFSDQAEKYIFWRRMADRVATMKAHGVGWISESWLRDMKGYPSTAIRNLPITGEHLHVIVADKLGVIRQVVWKIARDGLDGKPSLQRLPDDSNFNVTPAYLAPIRRGWGLPDEGIR